ncbi:type II toxin-antitoxin system HicA family toxin [Candidatus Curtissbacteria bacterium]|nr:type II toxin-antitoxin system HicA family toxin [Candidatus Curtissbacteria bacterium]
MPRIVEIHWRKLVKILEADGAVVVGQAGDHIEMKLVFIIIKNNLETAGISRNRYFELLKKI